METVFAGFIFLLMFGAIASIIYLIVHNIRTRIYFKYDSQNPYRRSCKKCGAHQNAYCQSMQTWNNQWWEEVYPLGNNPDCGCHKFAEQ